MSSAQIEDHLVVALKKLEIAVEKVVATSGYTSDAKKIKLLAELIKEQIKNENALSSARTLR